MQLTISQLKQWASEAGHAVDGEVHKFLDWAEGKTAETDAVELLQSHGYTVSPPPTIRSV